MLNRVGHRCDERDKCLQPVVYFVGIVVSQVALAVQQLAGQVCRRQLRCIVYKIKRTIVVFVCRFTFRLLEICPL